MNLGDGNDTGVTPGHAPATSTAGRQRHVVGGLPEQNTFSGGAGADTVAYAGLLTPASRGPTP